MGGYCGVAGRFLSLGTGSVSPDSPASVEGGQASHAPPIHQQEPTMGGTMEILQQLAQALQGVAQPAVVAPQRSAIERMARYRPIDFMGKKDDEPATA